MTINPLEDVTEDTTTEDTTEAEATLILNIRTIDGEKYASVPLTPDAAEQHMDFLDEAAEAGGTLPLEVERRKYPIHIAAHHAASWFLTDIEKPEPDHEDEDEDEGKDVKPEKEDKGKRPRRR